jgi:tyrosyl-tRNA synthetase
MPPNGLKFSHYCPRNRSDQLIAEHATAPHARALQKKLAEEITCFVHSRADYEFAVKASEILFGNASTELLTSLNEKQLLQVMEGVPTAEIERNKIEEGYDLISLLADTGITPSKGEAKKLLSAGGVAINKEKLTADKTAVSAQDLLQDKYILVQKGKKNYFLVKVI